MTPARSIRDRAEALLREGDEFSVVTDASADPVLVGVATRTQSLVLAIDRSEYDGEAFALLLGFPALQPPAAIEKARANVSRETKRRRAA